MNNFSRCWCGAWHKKAPKVKPGEKPHTSMVAAVIRNRRGA